MAIDAVFSGLIVTMSRYYNLIGKVDSRGEVVMNVKAKVELRGRILKIIPVSVYEGKVYTQDIVIELDNFMKLRIDDIHKRCEQKDLGKVKNLHVKAVSVSPIKKYQVIELNITPFKLKDMDPMDTGPSAIISGQLEEIIFPEGGPGETYGVVNVGVGRVALVLFKEHLDEFKEGDYIHVDSATLYLIGLEN